MNVRASSALHGAWGLRVQHLPSVERKALCVGAVRSCVVNGGDGIPEQPHPCANVHVHLTSTQERLAWREQTHIAVSD